MNSLTTNSSRADRTVTSARQTKNDDHDRQDIKIRREQENRAMKSKSMKAFSL
jgi:hypothetical protein